MSDNPKGELVLAKQIEKATAELLMDLIDASNDAELSFEERAAAMLPAGALSFNDRGDRGNDDGTLLVSRTSIR